MNTKHSLDKEVAKVYNKNNNFKGGKKSRQILVFAAENLLFDEKVL